MLPKSVGSSLTVRAEINRPNSVSSTPEKSVASPYVMRFRLLRIPAFRLRVERGT